LEEFEIAHLATSDGIGIELFFHMELKKLSDSIFNTGLFIFVSKIQISKTSSLKLYLTAANKECLFENIIQKINL
jgi:hypothetical protein